MGLFGEKTLVKFVKLLPLNIKSKNPIQKNPHITYVKLLPLNIKSINPIQKHPHITESYACILKIFVIMFLLFKSFLISFGMCAIPKLSKYVTVWVFTYNAIQ